MNLILSLKATLGVLYDPSIHAKPSPFSQKKERTEPVKEKQPITSVLTDPERNLFDFAKHNVAAKVDTKGISAELTEAEKRALADKKIGNLVLAEKVKRLYILKSTRREMADSLSISPDYVKAIVAALLSASPDLKATA